MEKFKSLRVEKLLITSQPFNLSTFKQKQALLAFTMAEILLSLTIIGVVAAITLPSLTGNINERTWNTQRKALYARISQAIALMPALNGFGSDNKAGETFITAGLSKVLKINNICADNLADCGVVSKFNRMNANQMDTPKTLYELNSWFESISINGRSFTTINTDAVAFETQNGESIVAYYNKNCRTEYLAEDNLINGDQVYGFTHSNMCINFLYDLNGKKGPNTLGKDMGVITAFNATDSIVVAPMPSSAKEAKNASVITWENATKSCTEDDPESRVPNINELSAMLINMDIFNLKTKTWYWSSSVYDSNRIWNINTLQGIRETHDKGNTYGAFIRCVKR